MTSMPRGILIALVVVPALALAAPRKRPKAKKAEPEKTAEPPATPAPTPDPAPAPQASGTTPASAPATQTPPSTTAPTASPTTSTTPPAGTGSGAPAGGGSEEPESKDVDIDTLRQEYLSLRDELFKSRARANAVASQLYSTRMTIKFTWGSARYYGVSKASIRLDGATVFEDATGAIAADDGIRFDGYVAPGRHLITFHVEATGKDDDTFTSTTEAQVTVKAVANKDLIVSAKGRDSGDIAYEWKKSERGSYGLGIDVGVKSVAQGGAAARSKK